MSTVKKSLELAVKKKAGGKLKAVKRLWKWVTQSDGKKKKVYKDAKPATSSVLGRKGARQLAGAGDASNPSTGIQRGKQKRSGGSGNPAEQGNTIKSSNFFARKKAASGSYKWAKSLPKGEAMALVDEFTKLIPSRKRSVLANMSLGRPTKYDPVMKKIKPTRGSKKVDPTAGSPDIADSVGAPSRAEAKKILKAKRKAAEKKTKKKSTGGTIKREHGGKIQMAKASWMDGLTKKQIDEILGRPTRDSSGVKKSGITIVPKKKKKSKPIKVKPAKAGGALKPKKSAYKTGGVVKRNTGGRIAPSKGWGKARIK